MTMTHDLGDGHTFTWARTSYDEHGELSEHGLVIGLVEEHPTDHGESRHGCYVPVFWAEHSGIPATHELIAGGPDDPGSVTVSPKIECPLCGTGGDIRDGVWHPAGSLS